jgi:hypothetical protein
MTPFISEERGATFPWFNVNVMDTVAGHKKLNTLSLVVEVRVPHLLTERIDDRVGLLNCTFDKMLQLVAKIIVWSRQTGGKRPHIGAVE